MLEDGRLAELGGHDELIEAEGRYAAMVGAQAGAAPDPELAWANSGSRSYSS